MNEFMVLVAGASAAWLALTYRLGALREAHA